MNASSFRPSILDVRIQRRDTFGFTQGGLTQSKEQSSGLRRIYISWTAFDWESSPNPRPNTYTASMKIKLTQEFFELQVISLGFWRLHVSLNTDLRSQSNDPRSVKGKLKLFFYYLTGTIVTTIVYTLLRNVLTDVGVDVSLLVAMFRVFYTSLISINAQPEAY